MAIMTLLSRQDLKDFVCGCTLLGVGGGGNPEEGLKALEEQFDAGKKLGWVDPEDLPPDSWGACAFLMGSTAPLTEEKIKQKESLGLTHWKYPRNLAVTTQRLEEFTGRHISALVPLELGGSNTPAPIAAAASLGKFVIDGDFAGRAVPEIIQTTAAAASVPFAPATSVDKYGNYCIIMDCINPVLFERMGKYLSEVAFGSTGLCGFMSQISHLSEVIVPGTLTEALKVGGIIRQSIKDNKNPAQSLVESIGYYLAFQGQVVNKVWEDKDGYYLGVHELMGGDKFSGSKAKIVFKNENHLFYKDDNLIVSSPDLIMNMDADTGLPLRNEEIEIGRRLIVLCAPCKPQMRTERILKHLGPRYFGADRDFVPVEKVLGEVK